MDSKLIPTSCGTIAITDTGGTGPALFLIHGNSSCKEIFAPQLESDLKDECRLIAMDLPGHGMSSDASDPDNTYHVQGYAKIALEVIAALGLPSVAIYGWSLGGHIGIEMIEMDPAIKGLMITGTPPVGFKGDELITGFLPSDHMSLTGQEHFTEEEVQLYAAETGGTDAPPKPFMIDAVRRTDGRARRIMIDSFNQGVGAGERQIVETSKVPLAIVNGDPEPFVDNDVLKDIAYANLWENKIHLLPGLGHAPFWVDPKAFNPYLSRFIKDVLG